MVPALAAGMRSGSARASAPSAVSTIRCEVSTFPALTAAGMRAFTTVPAGATTSRRRKSPSFTGRSAPSARRSAYVDAASVTGSTAFSGPGTCGDDPA